MASDKAKFEVELVDNYSGRIKKITASNKKALDQQVEFYKRNKASMAAAKARRTQEAAFAKKRRLEIAQTARAVRAAERDEARAHRRRMRRRKALDSGVRGGIGGAARMGATAAVVGGTAAAAFGVATAKRIEETEATVFALDRLTDGRGRNTFGELSDMAIKFGLDVDKTAHSYANFLKLQFNPSKAKTLIALGADMQALGSSADDIQGIFRALGQIKSKGRVQAEEMLQLAERGVSQGLVAEMLAKNRGISDPGGMAARTEILDLQQKGKIGADEFFTAFEQAINKKLGQSRSGESGEKFADEQFRGARGRLQANATKMWVGIADTAKPGLDKGLRAVSAGIDKAFKDPETMRQVERVMTSVGGAFEVVGETVARFIPIFVEASDIFLKTFGDGFEDATGKTLKAGDAISSITTSMELMKPTAMALGGILGAVAGNLDNIARALQTIKGFGRIFDDIGYLMDIDGGSGGKVTDADKTKAMAQTSHSSAFTVGAFWGQGLTAGMQSEAANVSAGAAALGNAMDQGHREATNTNSPSRVAMQLGEYWSDGLNMGMENNAPESVIPGGGKVSTMGALGNGAATISIGDTIIRVSSDGDPAQVAQETLRAFERNLGSSLARMAGEAGA